MQAAGINRSSIQFKGKRVPVYTGSFWTSKQREGHNLHEIAYRACFKPSLPKYFIEKYTNEGDVVYDPFSGRGTTVIEAALRGRRIIANDVNPISAILSGGRLCIPELQALDQQLSHILSGTPVKEQHTLSMFYHKHTLNEILLLREWLKKRKLSGTEDALDRWIRMVATNRLTGHSPGFFSVYTLPPNQAVSRERQLLINKKRNQKPEYRDVHALIMKKSRNLIKDLDISTKKYLSQAATSALLINSDAAATRQIKNNSVTLVVTSPPFLDVVQYAKDNWLRCWFNDIDVNEIAKRITMSKTVDAWMQKMQQVFFELYRITAKGGHVAFETGEIHYGKTRLETIVLEMGLHAGFEVDRLMINEQQFTKTANIWGIRNNTHGTNSNRIVLFRKK
ncbi:MAG TPA: DNA methyltransferase [Chitinophagales bacterium]|nr:DNA methyltransferase [Chitinophagales bacterium]HNE46431.1 DNA methyltransferase [Chitinophagales bacterium]HNF68958.1 DNA methyltransferase [Chitinophagales bacterium]HNI54198.1 DNA methyltransferase [Chitinophagales bacterium]HNJ89128.1 DNA methyltransferase [Chitinophagales bacterium]